MGPVGSLIRRTVMAGILSALQQGLDGLGVFFQAGELGADAADDGLYLFPLFYPLLQRGKGELTGTLQEGLHEGVQRYPAGGDDGEVHAVKAALTAGELIEGTGVSVLLGLEALFFHIAAGSSLGIGLAGEEVAGTEGILEEVLIEVFQGAGGIVLQLLAHAGFYGCAGGVLLCVKHAQGEQRQEDEKCF